MYHAANAILDMQTTISFYYSNKYTNNKYKIVQYSYTGEEESRKSGCFLWSSIPQKGHSGFEGTAWEELFEESESIQNEDILKSGSGANLNTNLWQHTQNHSGVLGQTSIQTAHLNNLRRLTLPLLQFLLWQKPNSGDSNGTGAEQ